MTRVELLGEGELEGDRILEVCVVAHLTALLSVDREPNLFIHRQLPKTEVVVVHQRRLAHDVIDVVRPGARTQSVPTKL